MNIVLTLYQQIEQFHPYSKARQIRRIERLIEDFADCPLAVVCQPGDESLLISRLQREQHTLVTNGSGALPAFPEGPTYLLNDGNLCLSRAIINGWQERVKKLYSLKVVDVTTPFSASFIRTNFRIFSADLTKYMCDNKRPAEGWDGFAPAGDLIWSESVPFEDKHLGLAYKAYCADTEFPEYFMIEPTTYCQLKCVMCPYHSDRYSDPVIPPYIPEERFHHMEFGLWKEIIDELAAHDVKSLVPQYRGEPYLNPDFTRMLKYAREKGLSNMAFPTNGYYLTDQLIEETLDADLSCLTFSFDALSKDMYLKIRQNSDYEKVMENIDKIMRRKKERGLSRPDFQITFVELPENRHEREDAVRFWTDKGMKIRVNIGLNYDELHGEQPFGFSMQQTTSRPPCPLTASNAAIGADGTMLLCHTDSTETTPLGKIGEQSIKEIYNSEQAIAIREAHANSDFAVRDVCANCQIWKADVSYEFTNDPDYHICGGPWWINYQKRDAIQQPKSPLGIRLKRTANQVLNVLRQEL